MENKAISFRFLAAFSYFVMVITNIFTNIIPLNGKTTGQISDMYPTLIAPAGYTFAIWGVIYVLLFAFIIFQLQRFDTNNGKLDPSIMRQIRILYITSSFANAVWIFAWHYEFIAFSLMLMIVILFCLIIINKILSEEVLNKKESLLLSLPFGVYYGWITIATVANTATLLVSISWRGFGITEEQWTVLILIITYLIATYRTHQNHNIGYCLTIIWALIGIGVKNYSSYLLGGQNRSIVITTVIGVILMTLLTIYSICIKKKKLI